MPKRISLAMAVVSAALSLPAAALAQGPPNEKPDETAQATTPAENPASMMEVTGTVLSMSGKTIVVDADGKKIILWATTEGAMKDLSNVKRGDRVTVHYTNESGQLTAHRVIKG